MKYVDPEIIQQIKKIDLLTYLMNYEPHELVKISSGNYTTKTHDSLKISNGMWNWFSQGIGGRNALDYLIKVKNYSFMEAVGHLMNLEHIKAPIDPFDAVTNQKNLELPKPNSNNKKVIEYLKSRCIDIQLIKQCIEHKTIYEDDKHNVVFVGYDENSVARYATIRATNKTRFMHDATGSDKCYAFMLKGCNESHRIDVFEGAIDVLSYASLLLYYGLDYGKYTLISLGGISQPSKTIKQNKIPRTISHYLNHHKYINKIVLHLDNDVSGKLATQSITKALGDEYDIDTIPSSYGKDFNDLLCYVYSKEKGGLVRC